MTQIIHIEDSPPQQTIKQERKLGNLWKGKQVVQQSSSVNTNNNQQGNKSDEVLLRCRKCNMIILQRKSESAGVNLDMRTDMNLPFLDNIRRATSIAKPQAETLALYQIPASTKTRPCPFRVFVTKTIPSIDEQSLLADHQSVIVNSLKIPLASNKAIKKSNAGYVINSGWCDEDGMTYELLFCRTCKQCITGVFIKSADASKLVHLNQLFLFVDNTSTENIRTTVEILDDDEEEEVSDNNNKKDHNSNKLNDYESFSQSLTQLPTQLPER